MFSEAGVENEELCVSQPRLQLFNTGLQLLQQRVGQRREGRAGFFHSDVSTAGQQRVGAGGPVLLGRDGS